MSSSKQALRELTTLVMSALPADKGRDGFYRPEDIAGYMAWELFHALHSQGAYVAPAAAGKIRAEFAYREVMKDLGLIDEERNITAQGMQHYYQLTSFYFKSE